MMLGTWTNSCSSGWIQQGNNFEFNLKKGQVGECEGDDKPYLNIYEFKERQEVKQKIKLMAGKYRWSADIVTIADDPIHSQCSTLFQIHDFRKDGRPISMVQIFEGRIRLCSPSKTYYCDHDYTGNLKLTANIYVEVELVYKPRRQKLYKITVNYLIDGLNAGTTVCKTKKPAHVKFGLYRFNAYHDVKLLFNNMEYNKLMSF